MDFQLPFALNNKHGWNFTGGVPIDAGSKGMQPPRSPRNLWFPWSHPSNLMGPGSWDIFLAVNPDIVGVAGSNMQWGHFVCPSCSQKRENTAFELVLQSDCGLSSHGKQVGRSSTPCRKRSQVWGREIEQWPKYIHQICQCWKWETFWETSSNH